MTILSPRAERVRFIPLRFRFMFMTTALLVFLLGSLMLLISVQQRRTIYHQLVKQGLAIAQSLAAASMADLMTYNYVALERSANQAIENHGIAAVVFHDKEGRVAGFSGRPSAQNTFLLDQFTTKALAASDHFVQTIPATSAQSEELLEVALPVFPNGTVERWGTVRIQLSLADMKTQIRQVQFAILGIGFCAIVIGVVASVFMAARITKPLETLMHGTRIAARGELETKIKVTTGDEVEVLADNFNVMLGEIITHRHQLEQQLQHIRTLQRYNSQLLATMSDGLVSVTMSGVISTMNTAANRLFAISHGATEKETVRIFARYPALLNHIEQSLATPRDRTPCEIHIEKNNDHLTLLVSSSVLRDRQAAPEEIIFNIHDISELKQLEGTLRQNERLAALGTLAAGMAHEIRNPLSSIKTFVQLLPRKIEKQGFLEKFQRTVPRELNRINLLVEDLLDLSRVPKFIFQPTAVRELIEQVVETMAGEFDERNINVVTDLSPDLPSIKADPLQLTKALQNILRNGIQAMPEGGQFRIYGMIAPGISNNAQHMTEAQSVRLDFEDTGRGIEAEALKTIFNPFFTTKISGTGLGLSITHKVITEHGGTIDVSSRVGLGTRFTIILPVDVIHA